MPLNFELASHSHNRCMYWADTCRQLPGLEPPTPQRPLTPTCRTPTFSPMSASRHHHVHHHHDLTGQGDARVHG